eukprot:4632440-Prymnesium_polylepis.2
MSLEYLKLDFWRQSIKPKVDAKLVRHWVDNWLEMVAAAVLRAANANNFTGAIYFQARAGVSCLKPGPSPHTNR